MPESPLSGIIAAGNNLLPSPPVFVSEDPGTSTWQARPDASPQAPSALVNFQQAFSPKPTPGSSPQVSSLSVTVCSNLLPVLLDSVSKQSKSSSSLQVSSLTDCVLQHAAISCSLHEPLSSRTSTPEQVLMTSPAMCTNRLCVLACSNLLPLA